MDTIFSMDSGELALAKSKYTSENKLVFAIMLKFFQIEGRYPANSDFIPQEMIDTLAIQLNCTVLCLDNYNWLSRTSKRGRQEIRQWRGD